MRVLEARFHPRNGTDYFVVGRVVWYGGTRRIAPVVEPAPTLMLEADPTAIVSKLRFLVSATAPESFERLQTLNSRFWSFVEIAPAPPKEGGH
jgi:hypothetical protein